MKTTNEVLAETGLTYPMLNHLKDLGIVPKPKLKGLGRKKGIIGEFEDDIIETIKRVKLLQRLGLPLREIAEKLREEHASLRTVEPQNKVLIPQNPDALSSYITAMPEFHEQMERENPGYIVHSVETESIEHDGKWFLKPVKIIMRPKE